MFEIVEKVVYINLEDRVDRKKQIERELLKHFPSEKIVRFNAIKDQNGGIGCTRSHIAVLEMAIKENWNNVLVVEDDAIWSNFYTSYPIFEKLSKQSFDVIVLGVANAQCDESTFKLFYGQTTTAYLINKSYYQTLLENFKTGLGHLISTGDRGQFATDQYWKQLQSKDNWYCVAPSLMIQKHVFLILKEDMLIMLAILYKKL